MRYNLICTTTLKINILYLLIGCDRIGCYSDTHPVYRYQDICVAKMNTSERMSFEIWQTIWIYAGLVLFIGPSSFRLFYPDICAISELRTFVVPCISLPILDKFVIYCFCFEHYDKHIEVYLQFIEDLWVMGTQCNLRSCWDLRYHRYMWLIDWRFIIVFVLSLIVSYFPWASIKLINPISCNSCLLQITTRHPLTAEIYFCYRLINYVE